MHKKYMSTAYTTKKIEKGLVYCGSAVLARRSTVDEIDWHAWLP